MDTDDVIAQATHGYVKGLADELQVKLARMYELLSKDNPYPKTWRILRPLGRLNPEGLRLVQADFNARCESLLSEASAAVSPAELHKELSEVIQAALAEKPAATQLLEITQAISILIKRKNEIDNGVAYPRVVSR